MGRGLVEPVDELDQASPETALVPVLDLLAKELVESRYDVGRLIRAIVSTRAYARTTVVPKGVPGERARALHAVAHQKQLHADQLAQALLQATNLWTYDDGRNFLVRLGHFKEVSDFVKRHGEDLDAERPEPATLLRRLLLLNGTLLERRVSQEDGPGSVARVAELAPDDATLVETLYLMALTRRPTEAERTHFTGRVAHTAKGARRQAAADVAWALVNSTEFSWN